MIGSVHWPQAALLKQRSSILGLAVVAVFPVATRPAFDLFPIYENHLRWQAANQVGPLHHFVALTAAVRRLVRPTMQLKRSAAGRFHRQLVEPAADQRPAEARVVVAELDAEHALPSAPQHV